MKNICISAIVLLTCLAMAGDSPGRGLGGGHVGGGGGGARPGGGGGGAARAPVNRTPSISRPAPARPAQVPSGGGLPAGGRNPGNITRPNPGTLPGAASRPGAGTRPAVENRPARDQMQNFLDLPRGGGAAHPGTLPATRPGGGMAGGAAADFLQRRPEAGTRPAVGERPAVSERPAFGERPGAGERLSPGTLDRPRAGEGHLAQNRPDRIENRPERAGERQDRRREVLDQFRGQHDHDHWFDNDFWRNHPHAHWHFHNGNWWAAAGWGALTGWLAAGWAEPAYYNYGDNVYYEGDQVYYGNQPYGTAEQYADQAQQLAESVPQVNPDQVQWMPLGVFAITQDGQATGAEPTMFVQLAVSKEGILAGTFQNTATNKVQSIEGMVDKKSQRAAWGPVGKQWPIMETGIHNLTLDTAPALIHFADGETQQRLLIRMQDPTGGQPAAQNAPITIRR